MNRRATALPICVLLLSLCAIPGAVAGPRRGAGTFEHAAKNPSPSAAYQWLEISLEATAREVDRNGARPTILSRTLAIPLTSMYDAWAAYDETAVGTRLGGTLRRPAAERTLAFKEKAIAYAAYRSLLDVYPDDATWLASEMKRMGFDPADATVDPATPQGVGNLAAAAVIAYRRQDGANQHGDEGGREGTAYSDYTDYAPVNSQRVSDPDRWQPIPFSNGRGGTVVPGYLTPQWGRVKTFALESSDQFRPPPPPKVGSDQLRNEVEEVLSMNANLTVRDKAMVEFMRDGPRSTGQSGHWLRFAQDVSRRDGYGLDQDVKLFFSVANVAMDAFIACWESKRFYDSSRPWTLVRHYHQGESIHGWAGPGKGSVVLPAAEWHPYSPATFVTPPFPGYVSGHSTVSAASARMLEHFTGSDRFGAVERRRAGVLTEEGFSIAQMQARDGKAATKIRVAEVILEMPTFTATAEMAGISRILGGYHIQSDNVEGLALGRKVADWSWPKYQAYFDGTAPVRD